MILNDKICVITGASSGIGAGFCEALVNKGAVVYGLARRKDRLDGMQSALGERFIPVQADITRKSELESFVNNTFSDSHPPHILINNAGVGGFQNVEAMSTEDWENMVNVNLSGVFYMTRLLVPFLKKNADVSHIVNIASVAGLVANPRLSAYNATKFGLRGFSNALMKELREHAIKVTCMYPGSVATEFFEKTGSGIHSNMLQVEDVADMLIYLLETPDNFLVDEIVVRPLIPKPPQS